MRDKSFHDYVVFDLLEEMGGIKSRAMFGGWGLYKDGMIFGIITEGSLYFKVDETNKEEYKNFGSRPFTYQNKGKEYAMSYWLIPEEIMEDRERLFELVEQSVTINQEKESLKKKGARKSRRT